MPCACGSWHASWPCASLGPRRLGHPSLAGTSAERMRARRSQYAHPMTDAWSGRVGRNGRTWRQGLRCRWPGMIGICAGRRVATSCHSTAACRIRRRGHQGLVACAHLQEVRKPRAWRLRASYLRGSAGGCIWSYQTRECFKPSLAALALAAPARLLQVECSGPVHCVRSSLCPRSHAWSRVMGSRHRAHRASPRPTLGSHALRCRWCATPYPRSVAEPGFGMAHLPAGHGPGYDDGPARKRGLGSMNCCVRW